MDMDLSFYGLAKAHMPKPTDLRNEAFRLSREERDYIAGHALDAIGRYAKELAETVDPTREEWIGILDYNESTSDLSRSIVVLSNLLGDIGWEREATGAEYLPSVQTVWVLGELFPVAQLRPWLEGWVDVDNAGSTDETPEKLKKLGTGAILLARLEKWMASRGN